jgi:hypothetical protein
METQCVFCGLAEYFLGAIHVNIKLQTVKYSKTIEEG